MEEFVTVKHQGLYLESLFPYFFTVTYKAKNFFITVVSDKVTLAFAFQRYNHVRGVC